ncbi:MAG: hypothetical protein NC114_11805 [Ruminococcus flavefaciens]|nr:hypothetical protein [Ruminococcus flavefaciens]
MTPSPKSLIVILLAAATIPLTACVDDPDGECNTRDYSEVRRLDLSPDATSASGSEGRDEQNAPAESEAEPAQTDHDPAL